MNLRTDDMNPIDIQGEDLYEVDTDEGGWARFVQGENNMLGEPQDGWFYPDFVQPGDFLRKHERRKMHITIKGISVMVLTVPVRWKLKKNSFLSPRYMWRFRVLHLDGALPMVENVEFEAAEAYEYEIWRDGECVHTGD